MMQAVYKHLATQFNLPSEQKGTYIKRNEQRKPEASQLVWTFEQHVVVDTHPQYAEQFEKLMTDGDSLTVAEIANKLGVQVLEQDNLYTIHDNDFVPQTTRFKVRQLTPNDEKAFKAFLDQCSERDKEYGEVGLSDEVIFGVLDKERIIAAASSFEWHGFVDIGVLTDPHYRGRGVGRAAVAAVVQHYLSVNDTRHLLYRHETSNIGSGKIARAVGWQHFATVDYLRFEEVTL